MRPITRRRHGPSSQATAPGSRHSPGPGPRMSAPMRSAWAGGPSKALTKGRPVLDRIPESRREALLAGLRATFNTTTIDGLERVGGGLSGSLVYRIVVKGQPYLLRMVM